MANIRKLVPFNTKPVGRSFVPLIRDRLFPDIMCCPMIEGNGFIKNYAVKYPWLKGTLSNNALWVSARSGPRARSVDALGNDLMAFGDSSLFLPTAAVTFIIGYRKTDTTNRVVSAFGVLNGPAQDPTGAQRCGCHLPFSDGTVYWDFGSASSPGRISIGGLTFGDDVWGFSSGAAGMTIHQNGILRQTGSAVTRTATSTGWGIFQGNGGSIATSDLAECNFCYMYSWQLSQGDIREISLNPWKIFAHLSGNSKFKDTVAGGLRRNSNLDGLSVSGKFFADPVAN